MFVAGVNDEDPDVSQIAQNFFGINPKVLSLTLEGLSESEIKAIASSIPDNIVQGIKVCKIRCGF